MIYHIWCGKYSGFLHITYGTGSVIWGVPRQQYQKYWHIGLIIQYTAYWFKNRYNVYAIHIDIGICQCLKLWFCTCLNLSKWVP